MEPRPDHGERSYQGHGLLENRHSAITGGDSGIGRAVAIAFAREGADVVFSYLPEEEKDAQETVRLIGEAGRRAIPVACDIREEANCRDLVNRAGEAFGSIDILVNTTSVQAYKPSPHLLDYATTKGAIVTFTQGLAGNLAERGIRVNAVAPGPVWTPLIPATLPDTSTFGEESPLRRPPQPAETAPAYVFLASQQASYVTAEVLNATGGTPLP